MNNKKEKINNTDDYTSLPQSGEGISTLGKDRSFAMTEAHKRLRTNIMFSFAAMNECRVIGVTSAMAHEGKSTTSLNLAYDLLQAGKKTLLIDADMRLSKIANNLGMRRAPGLSNLLVGENNGENLIQHSTELGNLSIITCGDVPPNPTELLSAPRMSKLLETLKKNYEYIIIDLPPISAVSDAIIVSKLTHGMIIVVRQDFADKNLLDDTVHQLKLNEANIIGFVMTCAQDEKKYYSKYKYKRYYRKKYGYYGSEYGSYGYGDYYGKKK